MNKAFVKKLMIHELLDEGNYYALINLQKKHNLIYHNIQSNFLKKLAKMIIYNTNLESQDQCSILKNLLTPLNEHEFREFYEEIYILLFYKLSNHDFHTLNTLTRLKFEILENIKNIKKKNLYFMKHILYLNIQDPYLAQDLALIYFSE